jgi:hypothetical protein
MSSGRCRSILGLLSFAALLVPPATADAGLSKNYGRLPLHFEENRGQAHEDVRFLARGPGYGVYLTAGEAVLALGAKNQSVLRMALVGAKPNAQASGLDELPGKANYFIGKDSSRWRTNVPTYAKVRYREVYPGIDLVYYGNQRQLEYDFVVAPGADPSKIALRLDGANELEIDAQGDLVLHAAEGNVRVKKPVIYQDMDGVRRQIEGGYTLTGVNRVGFQLAAYDTSRTLVIDPVLAYSTYLGGGPGSPTSDIGKDLAFGIAADGAGNAYVTGRTTSNNFPTTAASFRPNDAAGADGFVTKLNATGSALVYSTYIGGSGGEEGRGIAVDAQGNAYVAGRTSSPDFPTTLGVFNILGGSGFVAKLDPTGSSLVYSTYLPEGGDAIAVDTSGSAYVTGQTASPTFPTTPGAFQPIFGGSVDAFVLKLDGTGSVPLYSTFIGGNDIDFGLGIAVDIDGYAYVTGLASSVDFPTTADAVQPIKSGANDAFVTKLNPTGTGVLYSTYLGGSGGDTGTAIALCAERNAYVTGGTASSDFPTTQGAFQAAFPGGFGFAFVTKLSANGSGLVYSTYLGGSDDWGGGVNNSGTGIAVDATGNVFVTGYTFAANFPTTPDAVQPALGGAWDAFVSKLNPAGSSLLYSTFLGGTNGDSATGIVVDLGGGAYVSGASSSTNFPTTPGAFQTTYHGGGHPQSSDGDAFVAKFEGDGPPPAGTTVTRHEEDAAAYRGYWPAYGPETGTFSGGAIRATNQGTATATFSFTGNAVTWIGVKCNVCGIATVQIDGGAPAVVDTFGPGEPGSLASEPVFTASGLAPGTTHTLTIVVTGGGAAVPGSLTGSAHVAVDAFDVTK